MVGFGVIYKYLGDKNTHFYITKDSFRKNKLVALFISRENLVFSNSIARNCTFQQAF